MLYLGKSNIGEYQRRYVFTENPAELESSPKPITLEEDINTTILNTILEELNGKGNFSIEKSNGTKVVEGYTLSQFSHYHILFGEIEKELDHEGPFFRGIDGETKGFLSFYKIKAKTNSAIVIQNTTREDGSSIKGKIFLLDKSSNPKI